MVPVEDCIATTGAMTGKRCGDVGGGGIGDGVWGAVKEGEGCKVTVDGEDFSEEVGGREGRQDGRIVGHGERHSWAWRGSCRVWVRWGNSR